MNDPTSPRYDEERRARERAAARRVAVESARTLLGARGADAIAELIPAEMQAKIKKWAKDNDCLPTEAIVRLIGLGLDASKAERMAQRKAQRLGVR